MSILLARMRLVFRPYSVDIESMPLAGDFSTFDFVCLPCYPARKSCNLFYERKTGLHLKNGEGKIFHSKIEKGFVDLKLYIQKTEQIA